MKKTVVIFLFMSSSAISAELDCEIEKSMSEKLVPHTLVERSTMIYPHNNRRKCVVSMMVTPNDDRPAKIGVGEFVADTDEQACGMARSIATENATRTIQRTMNIDTRYNCKSGNIGPKPQKMVLPEKLPEYGEHILVETKPCNSNIEMVKYGDYVVMGCKK